MKFILWALWFPYMESPAAPILFPVSKSNYTTPKNVWNFFASYILGDIAIFLKAAVLAKIGSQLCYTHESSYENIGDKLNHI